VFCRGGEHIRRRQFLQASAAVLASADLTAPLRLARADTRPSRIVKLEANCEVRSPFPPGGGVDSAGLIAASRLSDIWEQRVVVENRPAPATTSRWMRSRIRRPPVWRRREDARFPVSVKRPGVAWTPTAGPRQPPSRMGGSLQSRRTPARVEWPLARNILLSRRSADISCPLLLFGFLGRLRLRRQL
jgi:hypothetical protein